MSTAPDPLFLLHGFLGDPADWRGVLNALPSRELDSVAHPPSPGDFVPIASGAEAFEEYARLLGGRLDLHRAQQCDAVGYSMGGRLIYGWLAHAPERIRRFVCLGARCAPDAPARASRDEQWAQMLEQQTLSTFIEAWYAQPLFDRLRQSSGYEAIRARRLARKRPRWLAQALRAFSAATQPDFSPVLQATDRPGLLIAGELDTFYVAQNAALAEANACLTAAVVPGAGHALLSEAPEAVAHLIADFLA